MGLIFLPDLYGSRKCGVLFYDLQEFKKVQYLVIKISQFEFSLAKALGEEVSRLE